MEVREGLKLEFHAIKKNKHLFFLYIYFYLNISSQII